MAEARIVVRSLAAADIEAVERITLAAYGTPVSPSFRARLLAGPVDMVVATYDCSVAGVVSATRYDATAYVGSMAVDPPFQCLGIGRALMSALIERLQTVGIVAMILDATAAGIALYRSYGFVDVDGTLVFERSPSEIRAPASPPHEPDAQDIARAVALDARFTHCDRSHVVSSFAREPGARLAVCDDAYAIVRSGTLGPWLARDAASARALLDDATLAADTTRRILIPERNVAALEFAEQLGFSRTRTLRHMRRGDSPFDRSHVYGQASLGHG